MVISFVGITWLNGVFSFWFLFCYWNILYALYGVLSIVVVVVLCFVGFLLLLLLFWGDVSGGGGGSVRGFFLRGELKILLEGFSFL